MVGVLRRLIGDNNYQRWRRLVCFCWSIWFVDIVWMAIYGREVVTQFFAESK